LRGEAPYSARVRVFVHGSVYGRESRVNLESKREKEGERREEGS